RNFASPQDWTDADVKVLTLYFYGDPGNDANSSEQMSVGLEDSDSNSFVDYGDMNDIKIPEWQEWNIDLSDFTDVDMNEVSTMYIRFGDAYAVSAGGLGVVYMDDIRLYPRKCVPKFGPIADISGNCIVDFPDIGILGVHWLRSDKYLSTTAPVVNPVGHWELETGSGTTAFDSSTNNLHGTLEGNYRWVDGHVGSKAVDFGGGRVLVPDATVLRSMSQVTATAWIYSERSQESARIVVKGADNRESYELEAFDETGVYFVVREEDPCEDSFERHATSADVLVTNEWIHLAGSYDQSDVKLYVNGQLEDSNSIGAITISQDSNGLAIGNRSDDDNKPFMGKIDDVRVYATALPADEIAYIATQETGYVPLQSIANLSDNESQGNKIINFRDYAVIMDSWLEEKLWPEE
ncbi:MAG: LamG domain-containing protein, partial [Planctomycetota bacterium]